MRLRRLLSPFVTAALAVTLAAPPATAADDTCTGPVVGFTEEPRVDGHLVTAEVHVEDCSGPQHGVVATWSLESATTGEVLAQGTRSSELLVRAELDRVAGRTHDLVVRLRLDEPLTEGGADEVVSEPFTVTTHALDLMPVVELVSHDVDAGVSTLRVHAGPEDPSRWYSRGRAPASGSVVVEHDGVASDPLPLVPARDAAAPRVAELTVPGLLRHGEAEVRVRYAGDGIFQAWDGAVEVLERPADVEFETDYESVVLHDDGTVSLSGRLWADRRLSPLPRDLVVSVIRHGEESSGVTVEDAVSDGEWDPSGRTERTWSLERVDVGIDPNDPGYRIIRPTFPADGGPYEGIGTIASVIVPMLVRAVSATAPRTAAPGADVTVAATVGMPAGEECPDTIPGGVIARPLGSTAWRWATRGDRPVTVTPSGCRITFTVPGAPTSRQYRVVLPELLQRYARASSDVLTVQTRRTVHAGHAAFRTTSHLGASSRPGARMHLQRQAPDGRWTTIRSMTAPQVRWTVVVPRTDVDRRYRFHVKQDDRGTAATSNVLVVPARR